jgi:hypothetical protein
MVIGGWWPTGAAEECYRGSLALHDPLLPFKKVCFGDVDRAKR